MITSMSGFDRRELVCVKERKVQRAVCLGNLKEVQHLLGGIVELLHQRAQVRERLAPLTLRDALATQLFENLAHLTYPLGISFEVFYPLTQDLGMHGKAPVPRGRGPKASSFYY